jgi:hypothetical protein
MSPETNPRSLPCAGGKTGLRSFGITSGKLKNLNPYELAALICDSRPDEFFKRDESQRIYLESEMVFQDISHPRCSAKLACAITAWKHVSLEKQPSKR